MLLLDVQALLGPELRAIIAAAEDGFRWSATTESLNVNLVAWNPGQGMEQHINQAVDVVLVVMEGRGTLTVDQQAIPLDSGSIITIPRGAARSLTADTRLVYLSIHRARAPLMPTPR